MNQRLKQVCVALIMEQEFIDKKCDAAQDAGISICDCMPSMLPIVNIAVGLPPLDERIYEQLYNDSPPHITEEWAAQVVEAVYEYAKHKPEAVL